MQAVERPAAEGQAQALRVGQRRGDDRGALIGVVGVRVARAGAVLQRREAAVVEPADPAVHRRAGAAEARRDLAGRLARGGSLDNAGAVDQAGGCGPGPGQFVDGLAFLGGQFAQCHLGGHGCSSRRVTAQIVCKSLAGCTTKRLDMVVL